MSNIKQMPTEDVHILLDMDGVLSNFVGGVEELFRVDLSELDSWGMADAINEQREDLELTTGEFWKTIQGRDSFWAMLKPYPWANDLVNLCLEKTKGNVTIVTSPDMAVKTYTQKAYWVASKFPGLMRKFFIGPQKHLMAKENHILIDDSNSNIEKFQKHGGHTITFPQKWNANGISPYDVNVLKRIDKQLDLTIKNIVQ